MSIQDVNHLTISGHVNQPPRRDDDGDAIASCEFVLTHASHGTSPGSEQHYRVIAHDPVAEAFAARYEPGQAVIVMGRLELEIHDTLLGPLPAISITAHRIIPIDKPRNAATTASDPQQVLAHSASGPPAGRSAAGHERSPGPRAFTTTLDSPFPPQHHTAVRHVR